MNSSPLLNGSDDGNLKWRIFSFIMILDDGMKDEKGRDLTEHDLIFWLKLTLKPKSEILGFEHERPNSRDLLGEEGP